MMTIIMIIIVIMIIINIIIIIILITIIFVIRAPGEDILIVITAIDSIHYMLWYITLQYVISYYSMLSYGIVCML